MFSTVYWSTYFACDNILFTQTVFIRHYSRGYYSLFTSLTTFFDQIDEIIITLTIFFNGQNIFFQKSIKKKAQTES